MKDLTMPKMNMPYPTINKANLPTFNLPNTMQFNTRYNKNQYDDGLFRANYSDPYEINSLLDIGMQYLKRSYIDRPWYLRLLDMSTLGATNTYNTALELKEGIELLNKSIIQPTVAGQPLTSVTNAIGNASETFDYVSNPIKAVAITAIYGDIKDIPQNVWDSLGFGNNGRVNYNWDTGNTLADIGLEILSDPTAIKGLTKLGTSTAKSIKATRAFTKTLKGALAKNPDDAVNIIYDTFIKHNIDDATKLVIKEAGLSNIKNITSEANEAIVKEQLKNWITSPNFLNKVDDLHLNRFVGRQLRKAIRPEDELIEQQQKSIAKRMTAENTTALTYTRAQLLEQAQAQATKELRNSINEILYKRAAKADVYQKIVLQSLATTIDDQLVTTTKALFDSQWGTISRSIMGVLNILDDMDTAAVQIGTFGIPKLVGKTVSSFSNKLALNKHLNNLAVETLKRLGLLETAQNIATNASNKINKAITGLDTWENFIKQYKTLADLDGTELLALGSGSATLEIAALNIATQAMNNEAAKYIAQLVSILNPTETTHPALLKGNYELIEKHLDTLVQRLKIEKVYNLEDLIDYIKTIKKDYGMSAEILEEDVLDSTIKSLENLQKLMKQSQELVDQSIEYYKNVVKVQKLEGDIKLLTETQHADWVNVKTLSDIASGKIDETTKAFFMPRKVLKPFYGALDEAFEIVSREFNYAIENLTGDELFDALLDSNGIADYFLFFQTEYPWFYDSFLTNQSSIKKLISIIYGEHKELQEHISIKGLKELYIKAIEELKETPEYVKRFYNETYIPIKNLNKKQLAELTTDYDAQRMIWEIKTTSKEAKKQMHDLEADKNLFSGLVDKYMKQYNLLKESSDSFSIQSMQRQLIDLSKQFNFEKSQQAMNNLVMINSGAMSENMKGSDLVATFELTDSAVKQIEEYLETNSIGGIDEIPSEQLDSLLYSTRIKVQEFYDNYRLMKELEDEIASYKENTVPLDLITNYNITKQNTFQNFSDISYSIVEVRKQMQTAFYEGKFRNIAPPIYIEENVSQTEEFKKYFTSEKERIIEEQNKIKTELPKLDKRINQIKETQRNYKYGTREYNLFEDDSELNKNRKPTLKSLVGNEERKTKLLNKFNENEIKLQDIEQYFNKGIRINDITWVPRNISKPLGNNFGAIPHSRTLDALEELFILPDNALDSPNYVIKLKNNNNVYFLKMEDTSSNIFATATVLQNSRLFNGKDSVLSKYLNAETMRYFSRDESRELLAQTFLYMSGNTSFINAVNNGDKALIKKLTNALLWQENGKDLTSFGYALQYNFIDNFRKIGFANENTNNIMSYQLAIINSNVLTPEMKNSALTSMQSLWSQKWNNFSLSEQVDAYMDRIVSNYTTTDPKFQHTRLDEFYKSIIGRSIEEDTDWLLDQVKGLTKQDKEALRHSALVDTIALAVAYREKYPTHFKGVCFWDIETIGSLSDWGKAESPISEISLIQLDEKGNINILFNKRVQVHQKRLLNEYAREYSIARDLVENYIEKNGVTPEEALKQLQERYLVDDTANEYLEEQLIRDFVGLKLPDNATTIVDYNGAAFDMKYLKSNMYKYGYYKNDAAIFNLNHIDELIEFQKSKGIGRYGQTLTTQQIDYISDNFIMFLQNFNEIYTKYAADTTWNIPNVTPLFNIRSSETLTALNEMKRFLRDGLPESDQELSNSLETFLEAYNTNPYNLKLQNVLDIAKTKNASDPDYMRLRYNEANLVQTQADIEEVMMKEGELTDEFINSGFSATRDTAFIKELDEAIESISKANRQIKAYNSVFSLYPIEEEKLLNFYKDTTAIQEYFKDIVGKDATPEELLNLSQATQFVLDDGTFSTIGYNKYDVKAITDYFDIDLEHTSKQELATLKRSTEAIQINWSKPYNEKAYTHLIGQEKRLDQALIYLKQQDILRPKYIKNFGYIYPDAKQPLTVLNKLKIDNTTNNTIKGKICTIEAILNKLKALVQPSDKYKIPEEIMESARALYNDMQKEYPDILELFDKNSNNYVHSRIRDEMILSVDNARYTNKFFNKINNTTLTKTEKDLVVDISYSNNNLVSDVVDTTQDQFTKSVPQTKYNTKLYNSNKSLIGITKKMTDTDADIIKHCDPVLYSKFNKQFNEYNYIVHDMQVATLSPERFRDYIIDQGGPKSFIVLGDKNRVNMFGINIREAYANLLKNANEYKKLGVIIDTIDDDGTEVIRVYLDKDTAKNKALNRNAKGSLYVFNGNEIEPFVFARPDSDAQLEVLLNNNPELLNNADPKMKRSLELLDKQSKNYDEFIKSYEAMAPENIGHGYIRSTKQSYQEVLRKYAGDIDYIMENIDDDFSYNQLPNLSGWLMGDVTSRSRTLPGYAANPINGMTSLMQSVVYHTQTQEAFTQFLCDGALSAKDFMQNCGITTAEELEKTLIMNPDLTVICFVEDQAYKLGYKLDSIEQFDNKVIQAMLDNPDTMKIVTYSDYEYFADKINNFDWDRNLFLKVWHNVVTTFKKGYLASGIGIVIRNMMDSGIKMLAEGQDLPSSLEDLINGYNLLNKYDIDMKAIRKLNPHNKFVFENMVKYFDSGNFNPKLTREQYQMIYDFLLVDGANSIIENEKGIFNSIMRLGMARVEDSTRLAQYLNLKQQGKTYDAIIRSISETHFNYALKSKTEIYAELFIPFYSFITRNVNYFIDHLLEHPAALKILFDTYTPIWDFNNPDSQYQYELAHNQSLQLQIISGNIPLKKLFPNLDSDITLKLGLSFLDAFQLFVSPISSIREKLIPPVRIIADSIANYAADVSYKATGNEAILNFVNNKEAYKGLFRGTTVQDLIKNPAELLINPDTSPMLIGAMYNIAPYKFASYLDALAIASQIPTRINAAQKGYAATGNPLNYISSLFGYTKRFNFKNKGNGKKNYNYNTYKKKSYSRKYYKKSTGSYYKIYGKASYIINSKYPTGTLPRYSYTTMNQPTNAIQKQIYKMSHPNYGMLYYNRLRNPVKNFRYNWALPHHSKAYYTQRNKLKYYAHGKYIKAMPFMYKNPRYVDINGKVLT